MKQEAELKARFTRELKRQLPTFLVLQYATTGAPDREIVGNNISTRWEAKHGTPQFKSPGNQELLCMRLAAHGHCRYIIWFERGGEQSTLIVHPRMVHERISHSVYNDCEASCTGFDMNWLVAQIRKAHGL